MFVSCVAEVDCGIVSRVMSSYCVILLEAGSSGLIREKKYTKRYSVLRTSPANPV
jgi:hypothetical protein